MKRSDLVEAVTTIAGLVGLHAALVGGCYLAVALNPEPGRAWVRAIPYGVGYVVFLWLLFGGAKNWHAPLFFLALLVLVWVRVVYLAVSPWALAQLQRLG